MSWKDTDSYRKSQSVWNQEQESDSRLCPSCNTVKSLSDFPIRNKRVDGRTRYYAWCKKCHSEYQKINRIKKIFNLEYDEFLALGEVCPICGRSGKTRRNPVDHDHKTGLIRGRICDRCNRGLAWFNDSPELLKKCAEYLENPPAIKILGKSVFGKKGRVNKKRKQNPSILDFEKRRPK